MITIRWLHLTDLHQGMPDQAWLWPNVREAFFRDLESIHGAAPIDLVLFTGDLTQRGAREEFQRLDETLADLWRHLKKLGSNPVLLAVPGNHDLARPSADALQNSGLAGWENDEALRQRFWKQPDAPTRAVVSEAFANYLEWWRRCPFRPGAGLSEGMLPGEFAFSFEKNHVKMGVLGLNVTFLQLTGDDYEGRLALHPSQFHSACEGDGASWASNHHASFLLTHQPPGWLSKSARKMLDEEVAPAGRFTAHLFGHMHENVARFENHWDATGERRALQATSLFGLEHWEGDVPMARRHGYTLGALQFDADLCSMRIWPREMRREQGGGLVLGPDLSFALDADQGTRARKIQLAEAARASLNAVHRTPQLPGGAYNPHAYVRRPAEEKEVANCLDTPGVPVVIRGPPRSGKTWFFWRLDKLKDTPPDPPDVVVRVNFGSFDKASRQSLDTLLYPLATVISRAIGKNKAWCDLRWNKGTAEGATAGQCMTFFLEEAILPEIQGRLILGLDGSELVADAPYRDDFFGLLRSWCDQAGDLPWSRLRLVLALARRASTLIEDSNRSPFSIATTVWLKDFNAQQVKDLGLRNGVVLTQSDITTLLDWVGGHPYLLHRVISKLASGDAGMSISAICTPASPLNPVFGEYFHRLKQHLMHAQLKNTVERLVGNQLRADDVSALDSLFHLGVVTEPDQGLVRLRGNIFKTLVT